MDARNAFNSATALRFGLWLGRTLPSGLGLGVADFLARSVASRRDTALLRTLQDNFRVVLGPDASPEDVYALARAAVRHAGHVYFDLYHTLGAGPAALLSSLRSSPFTDFQLDELINQRRGAMIVAPHLSNFDLVGLALAQRGLHMNVLAYANPTSGYNVQNNIRLQGGINLMPIDVSALRKALEALRRGELVITGIDRPDPFGGGEVLNFFNQPARLPVGHVRLAMQANVPVIVANAEYRPVDGSYAFHIARWLEMEHVGNRQEDTLHNAQRVLNVAQDLIAAKPEQWLMFYPVWERNLANL